LSRVAEKVKVTINTVMRTIGYQIRRFPGPEAPSPEPASLPPDFDETDIALWEAVAPYTMTSPERVFSLRRAVEYVVKNDVPGDFVECGVWKGGSSMVMALTLLRLGDWSRHLYLYDTFEKGWPEASEVDVTFDGVTGHELYLQAIARGETEDTLFAKFHAVQAAMDSTEYPPDKVHMIKGRVEETIPDHIPDTIALLRLDTDWYESTKHELVHLYPRLSVGGPLIIDDYGWFEGARKATDEYFEEHHVSMLLHRVDHGGYRIGVKQ